ncbi:MAG: endonuclease/exonuclease/phosphatase family protein [Chloroflexota bacterium]
MRALTSYERPVLASVGTGRRRPAMGVLLVYPVLLIVLSVFTMVVPQREGLLAVAQIFEPHLFLPLLVLIPFAFMRGMPGLRVALLLCLVLFGARFMPNFLAATHPLAPDATSVSVLTWNVYAGNDRYADVAGMLAERPADVVLLQEADYKRFEGNDAVSSAYPYRLTEPDDAPPGMVLLSVYPFLSHGILDGERDLWDIPRLLWARLDLGDGRTVTVVGAHPISAYSVGSACSLPVCYEPAWRDEQITAMRDSYISPMLASGDPIILAGDFNVTEREPAYTDLARGLTDAWRAVGSGVGTTWRPTFMMNQHLSLLRIDYLFSSPQITPVGITVDCTPRASDHCIVIGRFEAR